MATIEDYASGRIITKAKEVLAVLNVSDESLADTPTGNILAEKLAPFEPKLLTNEQAVKVIHGATHCAVGERICYRTDPKAQFTEAVFLDELAEAMIAAGKARMATESEAVAILEKYPKNPKVLSKVSGKPMELCCSSPDTCLAWKMEKRGIPLIRRKE
jgi:hypothetical protein